MSNDQHIGEVGCRMELVAAEITTVTPQAAYAAGDVVLPAGGGRLPRLVTALTLKALQEALT